MTSAVVGSSCSWVMNNTETEQRLLDDTVLMHCPEHHPSSYLQPFNNKMSTVQYQHKYNDSIKKEKWKNSVYIKQV